MVIAAFGILLFAGGEDVAYQLEDSLTWILIAVFIGRALLGLRTHKQFGLYDEDDAKAYCRRCLRDLLVDGMLLTSGVLMISALYFVITLLVIMVICEIILFVIGLFAAGLSA